MVIQGFRFTALDVLLAEKKETFIPFDIFLNCLLFYLYFPARLLSVM
jgi:hypothetical protein